MRILVSGGGTGGHITPILAVAHELKKLQSNATIIYVGEKGGKFAELTEGQAAIDDVHTVYAGKFRRYHGQSWIARLLDFKTIALNVRDAVRVLFGTYQAYRLLGSVRPDVVFLKGGFVGVPVGFAAVLRKVPFVTHDSDALPGLANRLVGRWATLHATGLPTSFYTYPKEKAHFVGVLVNEQFQPVDAGLMGQYRHELNLPQKGRVLLVTGGSLGAQRLNEVMVRLVPELIAAYEDLHIVHQVGKGNLDVYKQMTPSDRLTVLEFMQGMHRYTGAADVVVTRAGANTLAELGVQGKACIVVPNPQLAGGHQLENAKYLLQHNAVIAVHEGKIEAQITAMRQAIVRLLEYPAVRTELGEALQKMTKADAAHELAVLLLDIANKR